jgi:hypothetical protein
VTRQPHTRRIAALLVAGSVVAALVVIGVGRERVPPRSAGQPSAAAAPAPIRLFAASLPRSPAVI